MASRMDRYYKSESVTTGRSSKNKDLYKQIEDLGSYTNIEGVATIEKSNEIDISKVKEMIKNRENYKKQKQLRSFMNEEPEEKKEIPVERKAPQSYDIKELLEKMETEKTNHDKTRKLNSEQYELLKSLKRIQKEEIESEEEELKELINTISSSTMSNRISNENDDEDIGLFDHLKSDTMVGDASSIKRIIEEEKKEKKLDDDSGEIDREFYTSSFGFTKSDFDDLKNINQNIKKSNKFIIILLISLLLISVAGIIAFFFIK